MMKLKYFALSMAFVLAVALAGCSANRDTNSEAPGQPTNGIPSDNNERSSAGVGSGAQSSADIGGVQNSAGVPNSANVDNDAAQGGGAGGTNSPVSNGMPNGSTGDMVDDIGDAAGDMARGAGNVARSAGNAIGDAANDIGRAVG